MANVFSRQITRDGPRNAGVKVAGLLDTGDAALTPVLGLDELTSNEPGKTLVGLRVDKITFTLSDQLIGVLEWESNNPELIAVMSRQEEICAEHFGGFIPDMTLAGYTGNVNFRTEGFPPGTTAGFTILVEFVKLYA